MYIHVIEHNLTITMNTGVVLHSLVIHAVVRAASGASQESQLILMTFGTLTELHLLQQVSKLTLNLGHEIFNGLPLLKRDGGSFFGWYVLVLSGRHPPFSYVDQLVNISLNTLKQFFFHSIYTLDLTSSSIFFT